MQDNRNFPSNYEHITMQELQEKTDEILENTNIKVNINFFLNMLTPIVYYVVYIICFIKVNFSNEFSVKVV